MSLSPNRLAGIERQLAVGKPRALILPEQPQHITDFITNEEFLDKTLFPRQATVMKLMALDEENLTAYDYKVIAEWTSGFAVGGDSDNPAWNGRCGTPGDLLTRLGWNRAHRRRYFHHIELLLGRRGSKNFLASLFIAWVVWKLISAEDPHEKFGIDLTKRLTALVFAGKKDQAIQNQLRDLSMIIQTAPAFQPFHPSATNDSVVLFTPRQIALGVDVTDRNQALIEIRAAESTIRGGRGPAAFLLGFDEFAFVQGAGSTANSIELFESAYPSTTQFSGNAPVIQTTSPWDREGQAWETYKQAMAINPGTGVAIAPDHLVLQLPSWELYRDHEVAGTLPMWPGGPMFSGVLKPIIEYDGVLEAKKAANPETFAVEYDSQWRQNLYAYLTPRFVDRVFAPYQGSNLAMASEGKLGTVYAAHGDPSLSQANFGFSIAHLEYDDRQIPHVVFDLIHFWSPKDFPDGVIDYIRIEEEIFQYAKAFMPQTLTFDQWNSAGVIQRLQANLGSAGLPRRVNVSQRFATKALNWEVYEVFKTAIGHDLIHAPAHDLARAELEGLVVRNGAVCPPELGDVRTKDVADTMAHVTYTLIGEGAPELFDRIARIQPRGSQPGPNSVAAVDPLGELRDQLSLRRGNGLGGGAPRGVTGGRGPNWTGRTSTSGRRR
jgi:hypothetical protein